MIITDLKCAIIGDNPVVRVVTDDGLSGYGAAESFKPYLKSHVLYYRPFILGLDPTQIERVLNIRHRGAFKPWGSAVSAIEMAFGISQAKQPVSPCTGCSAARSATAFASITAPCVFR
jgi:L-alanine-DL-glutamate epimerase-like enolase superfamily enzyme